MVCNNCIIKNRCGIVGSESSYCEAKKDMSLCFNNSCVPEKYKYKLIDNFNTDSDNEAVYNIISNILSNLKNNDTSRYFNIFFTGGQYGTGKTFSACVLINEFITRNFMLYDSYNDIEVAMYVDFSNLMEKIKQDINEHSDNFKDYMKKIQTCHLLVIDDIGACRITDYVRDQTFLLINERYLNNKSTIICSNYSMDQLKNESMLGGRIMSRLNENGMELQFTGRDRRNG